MIVFDSPAGLHSFERRPAGAFPHESGHPFDCPPEEEREAVDLVLKQMEIAAALWAPGAG